VVINNIEGGPERLLHRAGVALTSSNPGIATVPANVSVAAGATSAPVAVVTQAVTAQNTVTISGSLGGVTVPDTMTLSPRRRRYLQGRTAVAGEPA